MLMTIVGVLVGLLILGVIIVGVYISMQGDAVMRLLVKQRTKAVFDKVYADRIDFSLEVPFDNVGKQEGTILDAYMRIYLPQEQYSDVLAAWVRLIVRAICARMIILKQCWFLQVPAKICPAL